MGEKITVTVYGLTCEACGGTGKLDVNGAAIVVVDGRVLDACGGVLVDCEDCEGCGDIEETEIEFPARFEVCSDCEGEGSHFHPAIREHAYTAEAWNEEDDDFREEYMRGGRGIYGVTCGTCNGLRVVRVVDEARLTKEQEKIFELYQDQEYERDRADYEDRETRRRESGDY
jgi:hypothetical protein